MASENYFDNPMSGHPLTDKLLQCLGEGNVPDLQEVPHPRYTIIEFSALCVELSNPDPAISEANQILRTKSNDPLALALLAKVCFDKDEFEEALSYTDKALNSKPDNLTRAFIRMLRGHIYWVLNEYQFAHDNFLKARKFCNSPNLDNVCGVTLMHLGDTEEALVYLNRAIIGYPQNSLFLSYRALAHTLLKRTEEALRDLDLAISISEGVTEEWFYLLRGYIQGRSGNREKAFDDYNFIRNYGEDKIFSLVAQAGISLLKRRKSEARKYLQRASELIQQRKDRLTLPDHVMLVRCFMEQLPNRSN